MKSFLLKIPFLFLLILCSGCGFAGPSLYPENFPEDIKQLKLRESDVRELAPGVTYYRYHFDNFLPADKLPMFWMSRVFVRADGKDAKNNPLSEEDAKKQDAEALKKITGFADSLKTGMKLKAFNNFAREHTEMRWEKGSGGNMRAFWLNDETVPQEIRTAASGMQTPGEVSGIIRTKDGYQILYLRQRFEKYPVSLYFVVFDWEKTEGLQLGLEQSMFLKTVQNHTEKYNPLCAINGAYFHWSGKTYYPLKINGKVYEPPKGYDSKTALGFKNDGSFPGIIKLDQFDTVDNAIMGYHFDPAWYKHQLKQMTHWHHIANGGTPLTAVGFNKEIKRMVFLVSDGRFPKEAPGINFYGEYYFLSLFGCTEILSIDGGGSCTLLLREDGFDRSKNRSSDNGKYDNTKTRGVQNCIFVMDPQSNKE